MYNYVVRINGRIVSPVFYGGDYAAKDAMDFAKTLEVVRLGLAQYKIETVTYR